jgi:hypothetical protein
LSGVPLDESQGVHYIHKQTENGEIKMSEEITEIFSTELVESWLADTVIKETSEMRLDVAIVNLAIEHGFDIELEVWRADEPVFLEGHPDESMQHDLRYVAMIAGQYLADKLPQGYQFYGQGTEVYLEKVEEHDHDHSHDLTDEQE